MQDDARATKHVIAKLSAALARAPAADWCAIKLFYSEFYSGWGVKELPPSSACPPPPAAPPPSSSASLAAGRSAAQQRAAAAAAWAVCLSAKAAWALVFVGRQNFVTRGDVPLLRAVGFAPLAPGFSPWTLSSAATAVVSSRACVPGLIRWLREEDVDLPVDLAMDRYLARLAAPSYTYLPSLFQHMGHFSSLRRKNLLTYAQAAEQLYDFKTAMTWAWE